MVEVKILDDYSKLENIPNGTWLNPDNSIVAVIEDEGVIKGTLAAINQIHLDCTWVDESARELGLVHELEKCLLAKLKENGLKFVQVYSPSPAFDDTLDRAGYKKLELTVWVKEL